MKRYELWAASNISGEAWLVDGEDREKPIPLGRDWYLADEVDQRIADLEEANEQLKIESDVYFLEAQRLRAERVSDEILDDYIHIIKYGFGCRKLHRIGRDEAQAILDLRRAYARLEGSL